VWAILLAPLAEALAPTAYGDGLRRSTPGQQGCAASGEVIGAALADEAASHGFEALP
jgi:hypothetical protein